MCAPCIWSFYIAIHILVSYENVRYGVMKREIVMVSISTQAKVGLFVLAALILLAYMSFRVGQYGFGLKNGYLISAEFENATGLERDASVRIAGVEVGRVENIALTDGKARVSMRILPSVKLVDDVKVMVRAYGILGDKFIEIIPGTKGRPTLEEGGEITRVEKQIDIDQLVRNLTNIADDVLAVTASLRKVLGGEEGAANLEGILTNTRELTANLNRVVKENDEDLKIMMTHLAQASKELEKTFIALRQISEEINRGEGTMGQLVKKREIYDNLNETLASLREITDKINEGKGTIGRLINDEKTVDALNTSLTSLDKSMEGLNKYLLKTEEFRTFLSYRGEYLFDSQNSKGYFEVKIRPKEDKFYIVGLVADPRGKRSISERTVNGVTSHIEEWDKNELLFNAEIGKRFRNLVLRGGLLESTGGIGLDYFALNDNLRLSFEAFDFDPDRRPHLKVFADYELLKHVSMTAGYDDFISDEGNESPFVGVSIFFEDDDFKYLMSSTPIPK